MKVTLIFHSPLNHKHDMSMAAILMVAHVNHMALDITCTCFFFQMFEYDGSAMLYWHSLEDGNETQSGGIGAAM